MLKKSGEIEIGVDELETGRHNRPLITLMNTA